MLDSVGGFLSSPSLTSQTLCTSVKEQLRKKSLKFFICFSGEESSADLIFSPFKRASWQRWRRLLLPPPPRFSFFVCCSWFNQCHSCLSLRPAPPAARRWFDSSPRPSTSAFPGGTWKSMEVHPLSLKRLDLKGIFLSWEKSWGFISSIHLVNSPWKIHPAGKGKAKPASRSDEPFTLEHSSRPIRFDRGCCSSRRAKIRLATRLRKAGVAEVTFSLLL